MIEGTIKGMHFQAPLEPDGKGGHWLKADKKMKASEGDVVELAMTPSEKWSEPLVPSDLKTALARFPTAAALWKEITVAARWDWIRWINATKNTETRAKRIAVACSKLKSGDRRPCCFNRSMCTDTSVSKNGVLVGD